jgi:ABC-type transporter MlaC component
MRQLFANAALAGLFMVASFGAYAAADCEAAKAQVQKTTNQVLDALKAGDSQIHGLVKKKVLPYFDFRMMSRQVVPNACWKEGSKQERRSNRRAFVNAFRDLLVRTYSSALQGAGTVDKDQIKYSCRDTGTMGKRNPKSTAMVKTEVYRQGESEAIKVDYAVYYKKPKRMGQKGKWKVYNVYAAGSSLVGVYTNEYKGYCNNGGMTNLINKVKNK